ncbi:MAG: cytochrome C oxidase subunit IV family protein [Thiohalocapsa sp.]|uniref:cytochrome C oxidase subunit IV family protein n=1 Tax=Thiohalocapsa sp. TaxID=2497641 RepID=UPI0025CDF3F4|nr:cytochrome C oxidase subunit IV family protein [Thiohalocapsa sp.]MCG6940696.1 cytochrome C oxidase subunit IV family protein [Thiohalocapsa sp.]
MNELQQADAVPAKAPPTGRYWLMWLVLLALQLVNLGSSYLPLGAFNVVVNVGISIVKALLVMAVFMHLSSASPVMRLAAGVGFFFLAVLIGLSLGDYMTRP